MKRIAEFVMRGRLQALIVAVPGAGTELFFWLSAAVVALVTLRLGIQQGFFILLWATLPAIALAWIKFPAALMCLLASFVMASVLRLTVQWSTALLAASASCLLFAILLHFGFTQYLEGILELVKPVFEKLMSSSPDRQAVGEMLAKFGTADLAGSYAAGAGLFAVLGVVLGRYWQAELYNPGGFGEEFRAIRFKMPIAVGLVLLATLLFSTTEYRLWTWICLLPLLVGGIGLVHWWVNQSGGSTGLLVGFYFLLLVLAPINQLVCALAVVDSMVNIRKLRESRR